MTVAQEKTYQCRAVRLETFIARQTVQAANPHEAMQRLKALYDADELIFDGYADAEPAHEFAVEAEDCLAPDLLNEEDFEGSFYAPRHLVDLLADALEAQASADADPQAGRRKGYYDNARELRRSALKAAGRKAY